MENRNGLVVQAELSDADGHGAQKAAPEMINQPSPGSTRRLTLGADQGYHSADFISELRRIVVTLHVAQKARRSAIDGRTTQHPGYAVSQRRRKKIEEPFGWAKPVSGTAQSIHRGLDRVRAKSTMTMAACNLARLPRLLAIFDERDNPSPAAAAANRIQIVAVGTAFFKIDLFSRLLNQCVRSLGGRI